MQIDDAQRKRVRWTILPYAKRWSVWRDASQRMRLRQVSSSALSQTWSDAAQRMRLSQESGAALIFHSSRLTARWLCITLLNNRISSTCYLEHV